MSTETQARVVELGGILPDRPLRFRIQSGEVQWQDGLGRWKRDHNTELGAAIRRIAELEEERERVRELLDIWASRAHHWTQQGGDGDDVTATLNCCDELRERMGL